MPSLQTLRRIARILHNTGGWLLLPLFFFCAYAAFAAADEAEWVAEGLMVGVMAWSGIEFRRFLQRRNTQP